MSWEFYGLDERARRQIKNQIQRAQQANLSVQDTQVLIKESHKMRQTVAFGLERFWGEKMRLDDREPDKAIFWRDVWNELSEILAEGEVELPRHENVNYLSQQLWQVQTPDQAIALSVLTQLCNSLVWWTQRYKSVLGDFDDE